MGDHPGIPATFWPFSSLQTGVAGRTTAAPCAIAVGLKGDRPIEPLIDGCLKQTDVVADNDRNALINRAAKRAAASAAASYPGRLITCRRCDIGPCVPCRVRKPRAIH
jgi:hypothetical protein